MEHTRPSHSDHNWSCWFIASSEQIETKQMWALFRLLTSSICVNTMVKEAKQASEPHRQATQHSPTQNE